MAISSTIRVSNIGIGTTDQDIEELFSDYGPLKRCFVVKPKKLPKSEKTPNKTIGYVEYAIAEDALTAIEEIQHKLPELGVPGKSISVISVPDRESNENTKGKEPNDRVKQKKSRLIVRNIPWKSTETTLRSHFEAATGGKVVDVNILKKKDGKMVGCAFVQLSNVGEAAKAIKELSGKEFLGRPIAVDWAVSKEHFNKGNTNVKNDFPEENENLEPDTIKEEQDDKDDEEAMSDENSEDEKEDSNNGDVDGGSDLEESDDASVDTKTPEKKGKENWPKPGHDINENKTVFIRNISFDSDQEDLRDMLDQNFGKVLFARLVLDKVTEHPKGTAFVKFSSEESANKCIDTSTSKDGLFLDGRQIYAIAALSKEDAEKSNKEKVEKVSKDNRNLYLAREGLIREGTLAAEGVSKEDMGKRNHLSRWKKQMLKDLTMFVSPTRLCIRNLPPDLDDKRLKKIMLQFGEDPEAQITESKIMRDFKKSTSAGSKGAVGASKGFGFVTYTNHAAALNALRKVNNNPLVIKKEQRPIIEFSIENRTALNAREKRLQKSKEKNPLWKGNKNVETSVGKKHERPNCKQEVDEKPNFMGSINNPKQKNLPSHEGPKVRHNSKITRRDLKKKEKEKRNPKKRKTNEESSAEQSNTVLPTAQKRAKIDPMENKKQDKKLSKRQIKKQKSKGEIKDIRDEKQFASLVASYKSKLTNNDGIATRNKWFN